MQVSLPKIIDGGLSVDDRGTVTFVNDFDFKDVKRFYMLENFQELWIRAWHGHKKEGKYVFVVSGAAQIGTVNMDTEDVRTFFLSEHQPQVLYIPPGYYNNARAFEPKTKIMYFSTSTLEESKDDDYRESSDKWASAWNVSDR